MAASPLPVIRHFLLAHWRWRFLRGERLERFQTRRAESIIAHARHHAPFYRAHLAGHDLRDWRQMPTIDKQTMMAHFDTFNTQGVRRAEAMGVALRAEQQRDFAPTVKGLTVGLSSGTSGHRGLFLVSPLEQAAWAGTILARTIHHLPRKPLRVAFFLRSNSNLYEQVGGRLLHFRYFDLMQPLADSVAALNHLRPDILVGPPSLLGFLAEALRRGELQARPSRLISVAEVLEPQDKARLESVFEVPVHQIYQCTEGLLAVSCAAGSLHIQEDIVALQAEPLPGGEGRVTPIVTDLWRQIQPIIRYRLNDVLQLETEPCACGSPYRVIHAIEGRCDDICYFETRAGEARPFFPDTLRRMVLLASQEISEYQLVQERQGHLCIHLEVAPHTPFDDIARAVQQSVAATLEGYDCRPATLIVEQGLLHVPSGAKRRRVQRVGPG
ncbi:MAG: adenylate cyclase [Ardenticatenales bacterium]|nr:adenylate cyclase [Ardenticatenales bacterium]